MLDAYGDDIGNVDVEYLGIRYKIVLHLVLFLCIRCDGIVSNVIDLLMECFTLATVF